MVRPSSFSSFCIPLTTDSLPPAFKKTSLIDGLGEVRKKEMMESGKILRIAEDHITLIDHPELQDGPQHHWSPSLIATIVLSQVMTRRIGKVGLFLLTPSSSSSLI